MSITVYISCTGFDKLLFIPSTSIFYHFNSLITMSSAGYLLEF